MAVTIDEARVQGGTRQELESAVVRFAGDSGDGIQLTGAQFTLATALAGNDLATFPDFPAEIRAPVGTTFGVSAFQIHFGAREIYTIGDRAGRAGGAQPGGAQGQPRASSSPAASWSSTTGSFNERNLRRPASPPTRATTARSTPTASSRSTSRANTKAATKHTGLSTREQLRCKNIYALGLVYWMFERDRAPTVRWLEQRFKDRPGRRRRQHRRARTPATRWARPPSSPSCRPSTSPRAPIAPGLYRTITGHEALAFGLLDGARKAGLELVFCSYPITPASALLHHLAKLRGMGVTTFQAEDEIAAVCAAIGASYAGSLGVTASSGPGIALKTEAIGLAVADRAAAGHRQRPARRAVDRPADQDRAVRPLPGRLRPQRRQRRSSCWPPRRPSDCFAMAREAVRIAVHHMTPVMLLTDGYLANAVRALADSRRRRDCRPSRSASAPSPRASTRSCATSALARPWVEARHARPRAPHRRASRRTTTAATSPTSPQNHQRMTDARWDKVLQGRRRHAAAGRARPGAPGASSPWSAGAPPTGRSAGRSPTRARAGYDVAHIHLRHLWPLPRNLGDLLRGFEPDPGARDEQRPARRRCCAREYLVPAEGLSKVDRQAVQDRRDRGRDRTARWRACR